MNQIPKDQNSIPDSSVDTKMNAAIEMLETLVLSTAGELKTHVADLKDLHSALKSTAYNMARTPKEIERYVRSAVTQEYQKVLPQLKEDFKELVSNLQISIRESLTPIESQLNKIQAKYRQFFRALVIVALVSGFAAIGGTWGALKLFKVHTTVARAEQITTSGPIQLIDWTGDQVAKILNKGERNLL